MIICLEGIDGSGKSTVVEHLLEIGGYKIAQLRTPGFIPEIRELVLDPKNSLHQETKTMLFLAEMVEVSRAIKNFSEAGLHVVLDRFYLSTIVYQLSNMYPFKRRVCEDIIKNFLVPLDLTVILKISTKKAMERARKLDPEFSGGDAFELAEIEEWERRAANYNTIHLKSGNLKGMFGTIMYFNSEIMSAREIAEKVFNFAERR
jgi:thymidylate kinase